MNTSRTIKLTLFALTLASFGASAQTNLASCRATEEALSDVSVQIAGAYSSIDFDKAKEFSDKALAQLDRGLKSSVDCGCTTLSGKADDFKASLTHALEESDFTVLQDKLADAINKAELVRLGAETCWRDASKKAAEENQKK
jgi:hypothetical protein